MTSPEEFLYFYELDEFSDDWKQLGLDIEVDLWALQAAIMSDPEKHPIVRGTGGLRKMRFAPDKWKSGKSGAIRVCYVYFRDHSTVLLVVAYGKGEKDNLTDAEKAGIRTYIRQVEEWFNTRSI